MNINRPEDAAEELATVEAAEVGAVGLYLAGLAPGSRRAQAWRLSRAADFLGVVGPVAWHKLSYQNAVEIRAKAAERYAPRTAASIVAAVRAVAREAWRAGMMQGEIYRRIQAVPTVKGSSPPAGRWVSRAELKEVLAACGASNAGARDAALLAVLFGAGLRRGEAVDLDIGDYQPAAELGGATLTVRSGKGRKARQVAIDSGTATAIGHWARRVDQAEGPLLRSVNKGGAIGPRRLTGESVRRRLVVLCRRAHVAQFRPHDARRSYASGLLDAGVDLAIVARLLGHASIQVTAKYDRRGARAEVEAAILVRFPFDPAPDASE